MTRRNRPLALSLWITAGLSVAACGQAAAPTAQIIYVTPAPVSATPTSVPSARPTERPSPTPTTHDITVQVAVTGYPFGESQTLLGVGETGCETRGGYEDVGIGMQATIHDPSGEVLGFANFENPGLRTQSIEGPVGLAPTECTFTTVVEDVPEAASYGIEVGRRGIVQFRNDELDESYWVASLSIGD